MNNYCREQYHAHISVCICTYKRPNYLAYLLEKLQLQITDNLFTYSIVIVDNDILRSAEAITNYFKIKSTVEIAYYNEPQQNIALARNRAIKNARGRFLAFIDDDEFPDNTWLVHLFKTRTKHKVSGVLGPVRPYFELAPPNWIIKGNICERPSFVTGTIIKDTNLTRTGNVLLDSAIFDNDNNLFDERFGRTGGEDTDFFFRMIKQGFSFIWCNEACVSENVPPERLKRSHHLKRALMRGVVNSKNVSLFSISLWKSITASVLYTVSLPLFLLIGHHLFMKYLIKDCDHIGKILGVLGIHVMRERIS